MEYVIPVVVLVLILAGFVGFLVVNATRKSGSAVADPDERPPGIGGDHTPLGDTSQHAGEQSREGTTTRDPEEGRSMRDDPDAAAHRARPGEGEGAERLQFEGERPAPERPVDRER